MPDRSLPAAVFNRRVGVQIREFYRNMETFFAGRQWPFPAATEYPDLRFCQRFCEVSCCGRYPDGAAKALRLTLRDVPGVVVLKDGRHAKLGWTHTLQIGLPRQYPLSLHAVRISAVTPLVNPRLTEGRACLTIRGDVDRILGDLVFHVLMEPSRIKPPKLYPGNDHGIDAVAMAWYQATEDRPERLHHWMLEKWGERIAAVTDSLQQE